MSEAPSLIDNFEYYCKVVDWLYEHIPEYREMTAEFSVKLKELNADVAAGRYNNEQEVACQRELLREFGERCYALSLRLDALLN